MRKAGLISLIVALLSVVLVACGGSDPTAVPKAASTTATEPTAMPSSSQTLEEYAAAHAGGPGAIYVGDLSQLVGLAPADDLGGFDGEVPLDALQEHAWIYESEYYQSLPGMARRGF